MHQVALQCGSCALFPLAQVALWARLSYAIDVTPPRPLELKVRSAKPFQCCSFAVHNPTWPLQDWEETILPLLHDGKAGELAEKHGISAQALTELVAVHDSAPVPALFHTAGPGGRSVV